MTRLALALAAALLPACAHVTSHAPVVALPSGGSNSKELASDRNLKPFTTLEELREQMASVIEARRIAQENEVAKWRAQCRESATSKPKADVCSFDPTTTTPAKTMRRG